MSKCLGPETPIMNSKIPRTCDFNQNWFTNRHHYFKQHFKYCNKDMVCLYMPFIIFYLVLLILICTYMHMYQMITSNVDEFCYTTLVTVPSRKRPRQVLFS